MVIIDLDFGLLGKWKEQISAEGSNLIAEQRYEAILEQ